MGQVSFESGTDALRQVSVRIVNLEIIPGSDGDAVRIDDEVQSPGVFGRGILDPGDAPPPVTRGRAQKQV